MSQVAGHSEPGGSPGRQQRTPCLLPSLSKELLSSLGQLQAVAEAGAGGLGSSQVSSQGPREGEAGVNLEGQAGDSRKTVRQSELSEDKDEGTHFVFHPSPLTPHPIPLGHH